MDEAIPGHPGQPWVWILAFSNKQELDDFRFTLKTVGVTNTGCFSLVLRTRGGLLSHRQSIFSSDGTWSRRRRLFGLMAHARHHMHQILTVGLTLASFTCLGQR